VLRVYNRAGIPIVEGQSQVAAGQRQFAFTHLRAFGIEAYAHRSDEERAQIAQRIWTRCSYGTLAFVATRKRQELL